MTDQPDPLEVVERGLRSGSRSVSRMRLAKLLGVHCSSIDRWARDDGLPVIRVGRRIWVAWRDLHDFFTRTTRQAERLRTAGRRVRKSDSGPAREYLRTEHGMG